MRRRWFGPRGPTGRTGRFEAEEAGMGWQAALAGVLVALPLVLAPTLHRRRERLDARGRPLTRAWRRA